MESYFHIDHARKTCVTAKRQILFFWKELKEHNQETDFR